MTFEKLKVRTRKELAEMAKKKQVTGWHGMKKDELIEALLEMHADRKKSRSQKTDPKSKTSDTIDEPKSAKPRRRLASESPNKRRILNGAPAGSRRDKLVAQACDPWWIMAQWEVTSDMINRIEAAMGSEWHRAYPIIRVYDVTHKDLGTNAKSHLKDIKIHGQVDHWFIPVEEPAQQLKLEIGYTSPKGEFFGMARSNKVATPSPGTRGKVSLGGDKSEKPEEFSHSRDSRHPSNALCVSRRTRPRRWSNRRHPRLPLPDGCGTDRVRVSRSTLPVHFDGRRRSRQQGWQTFQYASICRTVGK